jgi:hypothetical protein
MLKIVSENAGNDVPQDPLKLHVCPFHHFPVMSLFLDTPPLSPPPPPPPPTLKLLIIVIK